MRRVAMLFCALAAVPALCDDWAASLDDRGRWSALHSDFTIVAGDGSERTGMLRWEVTPAPPGPHTLECSDRIQVRRLDTLRFRVKASSPTAIEVQLVGDDERRLFHIIRLRDPEWTEVSVPVVSMGRAGGLTLADLENPLRLRFWLDPAPGWAGGAVAAGEKVTFLIGGITMDSPVDRLPPGVDSLLTVDADRVTGTVNPHIYGQFLEHIYHSVNDGLYGELIQNRCFVTPSSGFRIEGDTLIQESRGTDAKLLAGDPGWQDYEFHLRARKTAGAEGFLVIVRAADEDNFYWWNLGGWGNTAHALELERDGQRGVISPRVSGAIPTGEWCDIRVRVEGDRIQGWLNGERLLDHRDGTHPRGRVGLGTWATEAEFTEMRVTDLEGHPLPLRFEVEEDSSAINHWYPLPGTAASEFVAIATDSPNTGYSARISLDGAGAKGIGQRRIYAVRGHEYLGRAWMRVEGEVAPVVVALETHAGEVMDEALLAPGREGWSECPFRLAATTDDPDARLTIRAEGEGTLLIDVVSLFRDDSLETGCRADLFEAVRALRPTIIRWPGGCFASIYRWKRSIGPLNERRPFFNAPWNEWDYAGFGTDEYIRLCRAVGAEPMIVLNLGSWDSPEVWEDYLQEALEWIEYCNGDASTPMGRLRAQNGHPEPYQVVHWELDNETWGMGVKGYAERLIPFAKAIRERWPGVRLYACTFWEAEDPTLLELAGEYFDVISYHLYEDPERFAEGPLAHEAVWSRYPEIIARSQNPHVTLGVTEWNAQSTDFRTGLFAGGILNVFERLDVVELATPALFLRRTDASDWDNAFINHDHTGWFPAPNYVVMKLYRDHYQPNRLALEAAGGLNAVATCSEDGETLVLKVVNPDSSPSRCRVAVQGFSIAEATQWVVSAGLRDRNTMLHPQRITPVQSPVPDVAEVFAHTFPAYSVTVMEFRAR